MDTEMENKRLIDLDTERECRERERERKGARGRVRERLTGPWGDRCD